MDLSQRNPASEALWQRLAPTVQGSSSLAVTLCAALASGPLAWEQALQMQCLKAQQGGHVNLAALLHLVRDDVTAALECYRSAGCLREALAVSAARLMPCDPEAQLTRRQYVDSILPPCALQAYPHPARTSAPAAAVLGEPRAAEQLEVAAANLLLLDQPAAAARVLASNGEACNVASTHAAARVAALAAAHKGGVDKEELSLLAAQYALQACLLTSSSLSSSSSSALSYASEHGTLKLLQGLLVLLQPLAGSCHAVAGTMLVLRMTHHLCVASQHLTKTSEAAAAAAAVADVCGNAAVATCSPSASADTFVDVLQHGDTGRQHSHALTAPNLQVQQVRASFERLLHEALEAHQPQQAPQQQQSPQPQQDVSINSHHQQMPGTGISFSADKVLLLAVEECLQRIPPSVLHQLACHGILLPRDGRNSSAAAQQLKHPGSPQQQDQQLQQQQQAPQSLDTARRGSLALCCAASAWVCVWHLHCCPADTDDVPDEPGMWQQHILPLLSKAAEQLADMQESMLPYVPAAVAATAARDSSALPAPLHRKEPGRRQQYTILQLHALNRPATDQQRRHITEHLRKRLMDFDVPMATSPVHAAAIASSLEQLLPGRRVRGHLPSAQQGSCRTSGKEQQQQHASRAQRRKGLNAGPLVNAPPPPPPPPPQPSQLLSVEQSAPPVAVVSLEVPAVAPPAAAAPPPPAGATDAPVLDVRPRLLQAEGQEQ